jgi:ABC-type glycerol-3-phosphate transport system permease component
MHEKRPRLWITLVAILEIMSIYLALQDQIVGGLTQGAVKG